MGDDRIYKELILFVILSSAPPELRPDYGREERSEGSFSGMAKILRYAILPPVELLRSE